MNLSLHPVEQLLFASDLVVVGRFECDPSSPYFVDSGPIKNNIVVFPRSSVVIRHENASSFVSTPVNVNFYDAGQKFTRTPVGKESDTCDWMAVRPELLEDMLAAPAPRGRFFSEKSAPLSSRSFAEERRFVAELAKGTVDRLSAEEGVVRIVARTLREASGATREDRVTQRQRGAVEHAKAVLSSSIESSQSLATLAREVGLSPYHLCRSFRQVAGVGLVYYRTELRLRRALDDLSEARRPLIDIALDYGFSSHAHFTSALKNHFGFPPSRWLSSAG